MKTIWSLVDQFKVSAELKNKLFLLIMTVVSAIFGGVLWLLVGRNFLPEGEWLFCFVGYPVAFVGLIGSALYLYNHKFA